MTGPGTFRLRRDGDGLTIEVRTYADLRHAWAPAVHLGRLEAANLAAELGAWLAGTDQLPEVTP